MRIKSMKTKGRRLKDPKLRPMSLEDFDDAMNRAVKKFRKKKNKES